MAQVSYPGLFPFCVTPITNGSLVGSGTQYPIGLSLQDAMTLYWKDKTFSFVAGGTTVTSGITSSIAYHDYNKSIYTATINSELDLVCNTGWLSYSAVGVNAGTQHFPDGHTQTLIGNFYFQILNSQSMYLYNNSYYPKIEYSGSFDNAPLSFSTYNTFSGVSAGTLTILGATTPIYASYPSGTTAYLIASIFGTTTWPYNP